MSAHGLVSFPPELPSPFFKCPPYTFHQDEDAVVFVVNVPRVALETVSLGFNANKVRYR